MWPVTIDTSGCRVVQAGLPPRKTVPESVPLPPNGIFADATSKKPPGAGPNMETQIVPVPVHKHDRRHETEASPDWLAAAQGHITPEEDETKQEKPKPKPPTHPGLTVEAQSQKIHHEEETEGGGRSNTIGQHLAAAATSTIVAPIKTSPSCVPQGLKRPSFQRDERYTLGGMSDSLYEYLIKVCYLGYGSILLHVFLHNIGIYSPRRRGSIREDVRESYRPSQKIFVLPASCGR